MTRTQSIEGLAATLAIILLLFSPMLEPLISLVLALGMIVLLVVVVGTHGTEGTSSR